MVGAWVGAGVDCAASFVTTCKDVVSVVYDRFGGELAQLELTLRLSCRDGAEDVVDVASAGFGASSSTRVLMVQFDDGAISAGHRWVIPPDKW